MPGKGTLCHFILPGEWVGCKPFTNYFLLPCLSFNIGGVATTFSGVSVDALNRPLTRNALKVRLAGGRSRDCLYWRACLGLHVEANEERRSQSTAEEQAPASLRVYPARSLSARMALTFLSSAGVLAGS